MKNEPTIKDSGSKREFGTGAHRDAATGKGRSDLLPAKYVVDCLNTVDVSNYENELCKEDIKELLADALTALMTYMNKNVNKTDLILEAAINITIAEGIHENEQTCDTEDTDALSMLSYGILQVSKHYEAGALKYGEGNWKHGMPWHVYLDSAARHLLKALAGMEDEPHIRAASWNLLCYLWTRDNHPELNDLEYLEKDIPSDELEKKEDAAPVPEAPSEENY